MPGTLLTVRLLLGVLAGGQRGAEAPGLVRGRGPAGHETGADGDGVPGAGRQTESWVAATTETGGAVTIVAVSEPGRFSLDHAIGIAGRPALWGGLGSGAGALGAIAAEILRAWRRRRAVMPLPPVASLEKDTIT